jgi:hypothetical protein
MFQFPFAIANPRTRRRKKKEKKKPDEENTCEEVRLESVTERNVETVGSTEKRIGVMCSLLDAKAEVHDYSLSKQTITTACAQEVPRGEINFFNFVVDPQSFTQTVH